MSRSGNLFYSSIFCQHLAYGLTIPVLILWEKSQGLSFSQIALIESIGLITAIIFELPSSFFADKIGRKFTCLLGLTTILIAFISLVFAHSFGGFLIYKILLCLGLAFLSGTEESLLADLVNSSHENLSKYLGYFSLSDEIGTICGLLGSTLLIKLFSLEFSFKVGLSFIVLALLLIIPIITPSPPQLASDKQVKVINSPLPILLLTFILIFFGLAAERGEIAFQQSFNSIGIIIENLGIIYFLGKIFSIIGSLISHPLEKKLSLKKALFTALIIELMAFSMLLFNSVYLAIAGICLFFLGENIFRNLKNTFILKNAPKNLRATYLSIVSFGSSIILIFTTAILGKLIDQKLIYGLLFLIILKALSIISLFFINNKTLKTQPIKIIN